MRGFREECSDCGLVCYLADHDVYTCGERQIAKLKRQLKKQASTSRKTIAALKSELSKRVEVVRCSECVNIEPCDDTLVRCKEHEFYFGDDEGVDLERHGCTWGKAAE